MKTELKLSQDLVEQLLVAWSEKTADLEEERPRIPLRILQEEALDVARLIEQNWETTTIGGKTRHGLDSIASSGAVSLSTPNEIRELQLVVSEANADYNVLVQRASNAPVERADEIVDEFRGVLTFLLEDGKHAEGEAQLAQLRAAHAGPQSMAALAMAIEGYAELAEQYEGELSKIARFPMDMIDESLQVARDLRVRSSEHKSGDLLIKQRQAIALRNRLIAGMMDRVSSARRAIRYVFSGDPDILRRAASDYERARRQQSKTEAETKSPSAAPASGVTGHEPTMEISSVGGKGRG